MRFRKNGKNTVKKVETGSDRWFLDYLVSKIPVFGK